MFVILAISITIALIVFIVSQQVVYQCESLLNVQPTIDVFPNSEILGITTDRTGEDYLILPALLGATHHSRVTKEYVTDADYKEVISFYQQKGACDVRNVSMSSGCNGDLQPFGRYSIGIDPISASPQIRYFIQLDWSICGTEF